MQMSIPCRELECLLWPPLHEAAKRTYRAYFMFCLYYILFTLPHRTVSRTMHGSEPNFSHLYGWLVAQTTCIRIFFQIIGLCPQLKRWGSNKKIAIIQLYSQIDLIRSQKTFPPLNSPLKMLNNSIGLPPTMRLHS
jgi:hypothetical protein